ncbi:hypothetical protein QQ020_15400 [Fulvivirgaceae bacterium BMA12]|uniref:DUF4097 domain-containing protein n=1 Tax=Agaribacillus aureus TaxID=3051825 RepID=A0ABT8L9I4_9BACT|nr:hypothetical protein [Fulvivirgaceae bacterium BMA12]
MKKNLFTLFFLCFCFTQSFIDHANAQSEELVLKKIDEKEYKVLFYKGFTTSKTLQLSADDLKALTVNSGAGHVTVRGHDSDVITVEADVVLSAVSIKRAVRIVEEFMHLSLFREGDKAILESRFNFQKRNDFLEAINPDGFFSAPARKIDLVVNVPKNLALSIYDRSGDLEIADIENDLTVDDRSGNLHIKNIHGNLNLKDSSGDMELIDINTNNGAKKMVKINDNSGAINLVRVNGNLTLRDSSGDMRLANINTNQGVENMIKITDNSGSISLENINGNLNLRDSSGDIDMRNMNGNITLRDTSGGLNIGKVDGDLKLTDSSGDIRANNINGHFTLNDSSGNVHVDYVAKNVHVHGAGSGDLFIKKYDGKISGDLRKLGK